MNDKHLLVQATNICWIRPPLTRLTDGNAIERRRCGSLDFRSLVRKAGWIQLLAESNSLRAPAKPIRHPAMRMY